MFNRYITKVRTPEILENDSIKNGKCIIQGGMTIDIIDRFKPKHPMVVTITPHHYEYSRGLYFPHNIVKYQISFSGKDTIPGEANLRSAEPHLSTDVLENILQRKEKGLDEWYYASFLKDATKSAISYLKMQDNKYSHKKEVSAEQKATASSKETGKEYTKTYNNQYMR